MTIKVANITRSPIELQIYNSYKYVVVKGGEFYVIENASEKAKEYYRKLPGFKVIEEVKMEILLEDSVYPSPADAGIQVSEEVDVEVTEEAEAKFIEIEPSVVTEDSQEVVQEDVQETSKDDPQENIGESLEIDTGDKEDLNEVGIAEDDTKEEQCPEDKLKPLLEEMTSEEIKELLGKAGISTRFQNKDRLIDFAMSQDVKSLLEFL